MQPQDADGKILHVGDRVYTHDYNKDGEIEKFCGMLSISNHPATLGEFCIDYDDGETCIVLNWNLIFKL